MRTTLKRGIGRSASANGNGHAVLPPDVVAPVTRYRQPARPRRGVAHVLAKGLVWLLVSALTVGAGLLGGAYLYFEDTVDAVVARSPEVKLAQVGLDIPLPGQPTIALFVGYDKRAGVEAEINGARSDTVMLVRADPQTEAISMLSFPRDLVVPITCGPGRQSFEARINEAYSTCGGPIGTLETVKQLTGLPINYLVTVDFHGFKQVVAKLGGVWMDVDRRYYNPPGTGYAAIDLQPGYQKLNGTDALAFVRYRHTDSDLYRLARQQSFIQAFKHAVSTSFSITGLPKILGVVRDNVDVGAPGGELSGTTLLSYGRLLYELPKGRFFQTKIDPACYGADDVAAITVSRECIDRAVQQFAAPDVDAPAKATDVAVGRKPKDAAPPPKETVVLVLNGNGVAGAAAETSYELGQRGYVAVSPANGARPDAPSYDYANSKAYYGEGAGARAAAAKLAGLLGGPGLVDVEPLPAEIAPLAGDSTVTVVLGQSYPGSVAPAPADETPEASKPAVVANPDLTAPLLREAQKQLPFPVLVPTVIEQASRIDSEVPLRLYDIAGRKTARLTFHTGLAEYWAIQMVRWNAAPAIRQPNRRLHLEGRVYELHFNGPKLHMVVLRDRATGTSYWVVNSLLNALSNETMLAIAKGLKPLRPA